MRFGWEPDPRCVDCTGEDAARLVRDLHLAEDSRENAILRVVAAPAEILRGRDIVAVVAADLATSLDVRQRSAGPRVLEDLR